MLSEYINSSLKKGSCPVKKKHGSGMPIRMKGNWRHVRN